MENKINNTNSIKPDLNWSLKDINDIKNLCTKITNHEGTWGENEIQDVTYSFNQHFYNTTTKLEHATKLIGRSSQVENGEKYSEEYKKFLCSCKDVCSYWINLFQSITDKFKAKIVLNYELLDKWIYVLEYIKDKIQDAINKIGAEDLTIKLNKNEDINSTKITDDNQKKDPKTTDEIKNNEIAVNNNDINKNICVQPEDIKKLFQERRELRDVSGKDNNCFFNAIRQQRGKRTESDYSVDALREKARIGVKETGNKWQAYIDAAPAVATHLHRTIVILVDSCDSRERGTNVRLNFPANKESETGYNVAIRIESLRKSETIYDVIVDYNRDDVSPYTGVIDAVAEALNVEREALKHITVLDALGKLLNDENVVALYFNGTTKKGHFQSYVMKGHTAPKHNHKKQCSIFELINRN